ncbi:MAG TPA: VTT domain-containing protein [Gemmatimonadales bacterium]
MLRALGQALVRKRGTPQWDAVIRLTGVVGLLAIYPTLRWPGLAGLVGFFVISVVMNGPLSPLFPVFFEPVMFVAARVYPPVLVGLVATLGACYMEYLNYYLHRYAIFHPRLEGVRQSYWVRKCVELFALSPFWAIVLMAFTPLPYWPARILGPLTRYPIERYLLATFVGRFPEWWIYAAFGKWLPISTPVLLLGTLGFTVAFLLIVWLQRRRSADPAASPH